MNYAIFDKNANLVDGYTTKSEVINALKKIVENDPTQAANYAVITFDSQGNPTGQAIQGTTASND